MPSYKICKICIKKRNIKFYRVNRRICKKCEYTTRKEYHKLYRKTNIDKFKEIADRYWKKQKLLKSKIPKKPKKKKTKKTYYKPVDTEKPLELKIIMYILY